jgi:beta-glucosidase
LKGSSNADDRTIHEIYAWPFARAIEAGVGSVMCSYNQINGVYGCENEDTLGRILKQELGFQGFVQSDWGAAHSGPNSILAGLDMDMPGGDSLWGSNLVLSVQNGSVALSRINDMATRVLATWYKLGQDRNYPPLAINSNDIANAPFIDVRGNHKKTIRQIGAASAILLKNNDGILPLVNPKRLGIIGRDAGPAYYGPGGCSEIQCDNGTIAVGWGSGGSYFFDLVAPLQGITSRAPFSTQISSSLSNDVTNAVKVASAVDTVVVFVNADSGEGNDRANLSLWYGGDDLVNAVASVNRNTIVVIHTPSAVLMPWIDQVKAVVNAGFPGEETGNSIADVLFGDVNPSGRLPYTIAKQAADYASHATAKMPVVYNEGLFIGYRCFDAKNIAPLFEFGYGLSYTNFTYSNLGIQQQGQSITITASITNSGKVAGAEVPQLYIGFPQSVQEPHKMLRGFDKIMLEPGQTSTVSFGLNTSKELSVWDTPSRSWKVVSGQFNVYVGASSRDIRLYGTFQN